MTHVWVVDNGDSFDNIYVFEDEDSARAFADRYDNASITEEVIITKENAPAFLEATK